ncbi:MAG: sulfurtransferase [Betaproteobacteria bacterium SG8_41]|nr:MAG: sulfurtransferase [Betaproteobacteria bacterium SG8_41]
MQTEKLVRILAGAFVLMSVALGVEASPLFVSKHLLWFTVFVGANLFQSGFTGICPLESILSRLGAKSAGSAA